MCFSKANFHHLLSAINKAEVYSELEEILFNPSYMSKRVVLDMGVDLIEASANHYYEGVTQIEVEQYYKSRGAEATEQPISYGLNSTLVKENGQIIEKVWKVGGMYGEQLSQVIVWLEKAIKMV